MIDGGKCTSGSTSCSTVLSSPRSSPRSVMADIFSSTVFQDQKQRLSVPRELFQFIDDDEYDDYADVEEDSAACRQQQYTDRDERCLQSDDETDALTDDVSTTEEKDEDPLLLLSLDTTIEPIDSAAIDDVIDEIDQLQNQLDQELMDLIEGQANIARFRVNVIQSILQMQDQHQQHQQIQVHIHDDSSSKDHHHRHHRHHHHREDRWAPVVSSATTRTSPRASASFSGYTSPFSNSGPTKSTLSSSSFSCGSKKTDATKTKKSVRFLLTKNTPPKQQRQDDTTTTTTNEMCPFLSSLPTIFDTLVGRLKKERIYASLFLTLPTSVVSSFNSIQRTERFCSTPCISFLSLYIPLSLWLLVPRELFQFIDDDEYDDYADVEEDFAACRQQQCTDRDERCLQSDDETDACTDDASTTEEKDEDPLLLLSLDTTIEPIDLAAIDDVIDEIDQLQNQLDQELMDLLQGQANIARFRVNVIQSIFQMQDQHHHRHHHREDRWAPVNSSATTRLSLRASASFSGYTSPFSNSYATTSLLSSSSFSCGSKKTDATKTKKSVRFLLTK
eukprot:CAMPEP_0113492406 /NCGR_PEP_ID=MMETSP0014_2-20120614/28057_1 /TAXON_ID=2857 /ORGANISM="Nitzschia sp." /LENGTH=559 /DNA_ID=CAMNT_0000386231 /DNA_START=261 /DNA_END=1942 /DNA_ORIENTATION=+ /assembly_acc=CAM_ASM_000159